MTTNETDHGDVVVRRIASGARRREDPRGESRPRLGSLLRREGLHEADLERFREEVLDAAGKGFEPGRARRGLRPEQKRIRKLENELARKEKVLAKAAPWCCERPQMMSRLVVSG